MTRPSPAAPHDPGGCRCPSMLDPSRCSMPQLSSSQPVPTGEDRHALGAPGAQLVVDPSRAERRHPGAESLPDPITDGIDALGELVLASRRATIFVHRARPRLCLWREHRRVPRVPCWCSGVPVGASRMVRSSSRFCESEGGHRCRRIASAEKTMVFMLCSRWSAPRKSSSARPSLGSPTGRSRRRRRRASAAPRGPSSRARWSPGRARRLPLARSTRVAHVGAEREEDLPVPGSMLSTFSRQLADFCTSTSSISCPRTRHALPTAETAGIAPAHRRRCSARTAPEHRRRGGVGGGASRHSGCPVRASGPRRMPRRRAAPQRRPRPHRRSRRRPRRVARCCVSVYPSPRGERPSTSADTPYRCTATCGRPFAARRSRYASSAFTTIASARARRCGRACR